MEAFEIYKNGVIADILCENAAYKGVKRVCETLSNDIFSVTENKPVIYTSVNECKSANIIITATIGNSEIIEYFAEAGLIELAELQNKRECYLVKQIDADFKENQNIKHVLLVAGSDKRGTIYGLFHLSELCGISPLVYWGDAEPIKKDAIKLDFRNAYLSKEPSVEYRGFFINDEWPAFGKWCNEKFGGFNAKTYDKVFELLLRLKGNYLWPAMWSASFSQDGPGLENAELADEYGIIMGASHHEPMCRAGVEWQKQFENYGTDNTWSFVTNADAITRFWKDGIIRNRDFEKVITLGMRGENDSKLMANATMQDNVNVLKNAIKVQHGLIREVIDNDLTKVPRMLAIYKEVEDFFFGSDEFEGLRGWDELDDVILLLSDDNFGNLRAIPQKSDKEHPAGYGLYYHFDYHGAPFSNEWLNNTNIAKTWEQLTTAYEYGIRKMWIVNVGDIKGNEFPLNFFMDLAYDYEKWGISNINSADDFTNNWIDMQFGDAVSDSQKNNIKFVLERYTKWSSARNTESINPDVFKNNFGEISRVKEELHETLKTADDLLTVLPKQSLNAYLSMIYYPARAYFNTVLLILEAAMNHIHAKRRTLIANSYALKVSEHIEKDKLYVKQFHEFNNGKWNHMMDSAHMCFNSWDDSDWAYPEIRTVSPITTPKVVVSIRGNDKFSIGNFWQDIREFYNDDMTRPDVNEILLDIDSRSNVDYTYKITCSKPWLEISNPVGESDLKNAPRITVNLKCNRELLIEHDSALVEIDFQFRDFDSKKTIINIKADNTDYSHYKGLFVESQNYVSINADNYYSLNNVNGAGWRIVKRLGRTGNAIKSFPCTIDRTNVPDSPYVEYKFAVKEAGKYFLSFYLSPRNPMIKGGEIKCLFSVNDNEPIARNVVTSDYYAEWINPSWYFGSVNKIRFLNAEIQLDEGVNSVKFYAADPTLILENIVIYPMDKPIPETFLPPPESYKVP